MGRIETCNKPKTITNVVNEINKKLEGKGMEEMEEILEIYRHREMLKIEQNCKENVEKIKQEDALKKEIEEFTKEIQKKYNVEEIDFDYKYTEGTREKEKNEYERMGKEKVKISNIIEEVQAQLSLCETYDQKINVLVNYNIIDKKTKKLFN